MQHVLPSGFDRIRHYGLVCCMVASATKTERLAQARELLAMPQADPRAAEDAHDFMRRVAAIDTRSARIGRVRRWLVAEQVAR